MYPKVISWKYFNGVGLFSTKNDKEIITLVYAKNEEAEKAINKLGFIPNFIFDRTPGIFFSRIEGVTTRARSHGNIINKYEKQYPGLKDKFEIKEPAIGIEYMGYIVTNLSHLKNFVNPIADKYPNYIFNEKFIKKEAFFDKQFVEILLDYKPLALTGGEIKDFQEKILPNFISSVKYINPEIFKELLKYPKVSEINEKITPVGKFAKVHSLKPGKVNLVKNPTRWSEDVAYWDGKLIKITITEKGIEYNNGIKELFFEPDENYIVKIFEEKTFNEKTEIVPK